MKRKGKKGGGGVTMMGGGCEFQTNLIAFHFLSTNVNEVNDIQFFHAFLSSLKYSNVRLILLELHLTVEIKKKKKKTL